MRQTAVFTALFFVGANIFAADTQLLNLVMPGAQIMAGVNVTTAKISPLGQYILSQVSANDKGLQEFIAKTGFDPRQDVTEVLAASTGDPAAPSGLVLAKGNFNVAQIVAAMPANSSQQVQTYNGATLISSTATASAKIAHALGFLGNSIAIAGDLASVKAAIDRSTGVNSISPALAAQVQTLSTTEDAWSVSLASFASLLPGSIAPQAGAAAQGLQFFKNIQSSSGGVKFGATVDLKAQAIADTPQDASALADVIRMIAALAGSTTGSNGQTAPAAQLLQSLQITTSGTAVNISASVPETQVEALLKTASAHDSAPAARSRRM